MELFPPYNLHFISANGVGRYFVSGEVSLKISSCCAPPPQPGAGLLESPLVIDLEKQGRMKFLEIQKKGN